MFSIQASNPHSLAEHDRLDETLYGAVQTVFPLATEALILRWRDHFIPLSYKYDLSIIVEDILQMLTALAAEQGETEVTWGSNTFHADWTLRWQHDALTITARWQEVVGSCQSQLRADTEPLELSKKQFVAEWRRPLEIIANALERAGYTVEQLPDLRTLRRLLTELVGPATLDVD